MLIDPAYDALLARIRSSLRGKLPLQFYVQSAATPVSTAERDYYPSVSVEDDAGAALLVLEFVPEANATAAARYAHYQAIESMQYILLADLCEPRVMVLYHTPSGWDCRLHTGWQAVVDLPKLECSVPLRYWYADPPYAWPQGDEPHKSLAAMILDIPPGDPLPDRHDDDAQKE